MAFGTGAVLSATVVITGLPIGPPSARPGRLTSEIVTLSGPEAAATSPAGSAPSSTVRTPPATAARGWSAAVDVDDGTQAVAASWVGAAHGAVEVRGRSGSRWTEWVALEAEPDEAPDDARRASGGMAWFGSSGVDAVEVRVAEGSLGDLELQAMRYEPPAGPPVVPGFITGGTVAGATASQPSIQPRSSWTGSGWASSNSGCASGPIRAAGGIRFAVLHHTVNANTYAASDVPAMMASIRAFHTGTNGWCDIAYNFVIDRFGRIWEGRAGGIARAIVGGHAQGFNTGSVGIAFLGQHEPGASPAAGQPTGAARESAARLVAWKLGLDHRDPLEQVTVTSGGSNRWPSGSHVTIGRVTGHRALGHTSCPGALLNDQLSSIRSRAHILQGAPPPPPPTGPWVPFASAADLVTRQYRDVLKRNPSSGDLAYWSTRVGTTWSRGASSPSSRARPRPTAACTP
ncbi:N-acetylmuramoyl-L-alanine amidase [Aquihabitans daechungensis]|uniref:N-acetylmuramoyl-L-alanine amidase n=1 Tax=Aquihabitans daechungensis TaxID=1052257 RepID=UPI003BA02A78